ncbi:ribbon-helix-helix domain-containing protein [Candidatus Bathyarchaeota archaeon]|nr:ribbon-helix-helix domain-containing protein [Candidatus Bathyarchaeota archaeon]
MPMDKYRGISLQKELVGTIENYINTHPEMGYKSLADFVTDAIREKCEKLGIFTVESALPSLEHFNISEQGVRVLDRTLGNGTARGRIIDVYFKPEKVLCEYCDSSSCRHVQFALSIPAVQKIVQEKGWRIKE